MYKNCKIVFLKEYPRKFVPHVVKLYDWTLNFVRVLIFTYISLFLKKKNLKNVCKSGKFYTNVNDKNCEFYAKLEKIVKS